MAGACRGGGLTGPGVRWRVDRDDVASVFPRLRGALVDLAGNVRSTDYRETASMICLCNDLASCISST